MTTIPSQLQALAKRLSGDAWQRYVQAFGLEAREAALALGEAIASSEAWNNVSRPGTLVVRGWGPPLLGVVGSFSAAEAAHVRAAFNHLERSLRNVQPLAWQDVERACEELAEALKRRYGSAELREWQYTAIPRGGDTVVGLLSYALNLSRWQLAYSSDSARPQVVVDDIALSGMRVRGVLASAGVRHAIIATLYSAPRLRQAVVHEEPRVLGFVSARDLEEDTSGFAEQAAYRSWQQRRLERQARRYWVGRLKQVPCFPWGEPDVTGWNPVRRREEQLWRIAPPQASLKTRWSPVDGKPNLQIQRDGPGPVLAAGGTLWADMDDRVVLFNVDTEEMFALESSGAAMWKVLMAIGNLEDAVEAVAGQYSADVATVDRDMRELLAELSERRLIEQRTDCDGERAGRRA